MLTADDDVRATPVSKDVGVGSVSCSHGCQRRICVSQEGGTALDATVLNEALHQRGMPPSLISLVYLQKAAQKTAPQKMVASHLAKNDTRDDVT